MVEKGKKVALATKSGKSSDLGSAPAAQKVATPVAVSSPSKASSLPVAKSASATALVPAPDHRIGPANVCCVDLHTHSLTAVTTRVVVRYDVGFGNSLYIRGQGANLSWDKGVQLTNVKPNEWVWETNLSFTLAEFKVLVNDKIYELGPNHTIKCGCAAQYTPRF